MCKQEVTQAGKPNLQETLWRCEHVHCRTVPYFREEFQMTLEEFVHIENLRWRDQKRGRIIKKILSKEENMVFVISPI